MFSRAMPACRCTEILNMKIEFKRSDTSSWTDEDLRELIRDSNELRCEVVELRAVLFRTRCWTVLLGGMVLGFFIGDIFFK